MKKTLWGFSLAALVLILVKISILMGWFGEGFQLDLVLNLILGVLFMFVGIGLAIFWMGIFLQIFEMPEALDLSLNLVLITALMSLASAFLTLFV